MSIKIEIYYCRGTEDLEIRYACCLTIVEDIPCSGDNRKLPGLYEIHANRTHQPEENMAVITKKKRMEKIEKHSLSLLSRSFRIDA